MAGATLDLVTHDDAQLASSAVHVEGPTGLSYSELDELTGEFERALRHDGKALVLCGGGRDLPTLLAYLAALHLGHAVAFLPASNEILSACQPEFVVPEPASGTGLADPGYRPAAEPVACATIFQGKGNRPAGEIYTDTALLLATGLGRQPQDGTAIVFRAGRQRRCGHPRALDITAAERASITLRSRTSSDCPVLNTHLLAGAGGFDTRTTTPLFLTSADHEPPCRAREPSRSTSATMTCCATPRCTSSSPTC